ncbi:MAG: hypothetical protein ACPLRO_05550 [Candidatus Kapaibacteriota bacterium]
MEKQSSTQNIGASKPGCSRNGHIFHMIFCLLLLFGIVGDLKINDLTNPIYILGFSYSIVGFFYSFFQIIKIDKQKKQDETLSKFREMDVAVLSIAKKNKGQLTPTILSLQGSVSVEEAKKILDTYVERGIAQIEVTEDGIFKYTFPELLDK